jgi:head-tail adaptor
MAYRPASATASELREWIALFLPVLVPDGQGGSYETVPPGLVADLPASVLEPSGTQVWSSDQLGDRVRYEVTIRYQVGITTAYQVMWRNRYLNIVFVRNVDSRDVWLVLTCERRELGQQ